MIYVFTFLLGFCSIVYELLLGQSLSAFLGNTVLRYSVTIGLYMLSMGIGALLAEGRWVKHAVITLLRVEILLTVTGGFSVIFLLLMASVGMPDLLFSAMAHSLIVIIGVLTGFEIPLLIEMRAQEKEHTEQVVLGVGYGNHDQVRLKFLHIVGTVFSEVFAEFAIDQGGFHNDVCKIVLAGVFTVAHTAGQFFIEFPHPSFIDPLN